MSASAPLRLAQAVVAAEIGGLLGGGILGVRGSGLVAGPDVAFDGLEPADDLDGLLGELGAAGLAGFEELAANMGVTGAFFERREAVLARGEEEVVAAEGVGLEEAAGEIARGGFDIVGGATEGADEGDEGRAVGVAGEGPDAGAATSSFSRLGFTVLLGGEHVDRGVVEAVDDAAAEHNQDELDQGAEDDGGAHQMAAGRSLQGQGEAFAGELLDLAVDGEVEGVFGVGEAGDDGGIELPLLG